MERQQANRIGIRTETTVSRNPADNIIDLAGRTRHE
jgi:hypothetical protein